MKHKHPPVRLFESPGPIGPAEASEGIEIRRPVRRQAPAGINFFLPERLGL